VSATRIVLAIVLVGLGVAGAVALSGHRSSEVASVVWVAKTGGYAGENFSTKASCLSAAQAADGSDACSQQRVSIPYTPSWVIPVSILVGFVGLAAGGAILLARRAGPTPGR
jgi:hypothetical protein